MKVLFFKKSLFTFIVVIILIIITTILIFHINKSKENSKEEINNIEDIAIIPPDECKCNDLEKFKQRDDFLKAQYRKKKLVALTFDDGPSEYSSILIDELKKRDVVATFFVLGSEVKKHPETLKFAYDTGNEIGIHSYEHKLFTKLSQDEILNQVSKTKNIIFELTSKNPELIRVPYGTLNKDVDKVLNTQNLTNVLWNVDSLDWRFKNTKKIYEYVMKKFKGNDIILMHDTFKTSIEAATLIIDKLQSECYTFVTVSEFLRIKEEVKK